MLRLSLAQVLLSRIVGMGLPFAALMLLSTCMKPIGSSVEIQGNGKLTAQEIFRTTAPSIVKVESDKSVGTGFLFGDSATIATCYHVVQDAEYVRVTMKGDISLGVTSIAVDKEADLAILKLERKSSSRNLQSLNFESIYTGDKVFVIGNPLGVLTRSMSDGIVGAKRRIDGVEVIQFTAPISEGSSGSPLLSENGKVIGVVTSAFSKGNELGLAISTKPLIALFRQKTRPIAEFTKTGPEKVKEPSRNKVDLSNVASREWSKYLWKLYKSQLLWEIAWHTTIDGVYRPSASFDAVSSAFEDFGKALTDLEPFLALSKTDLTLDLKAEGITDGCRDVLKASSALMEKQLDLYSFASSKKGQVEEFTLLFNEVSQAQSRQKTCIRELHQVHNGAKWFSKDDFQSAHNPGAFFFYFAPRRPPGVMPDPLISSSASVAYVYLRGSNWKSGDIITGVRTKSQDVFVPVKSWTDLTVTLSNIEKSETEVIFEVMREGSRASFVSKI